MNLEEKFQKLLEQVGGLTRQSQTLRKENSDLSRENDSLKRELAGLRAECHRLKLQAADRADLVTSKLSSVLQRLDELERTEGQ
ncbi:MAG TPA: hypothetical protein PK186_01010 [candidate division Zixibacteria bacterium]|nr:cell division protein ZapB [candidate division Zixibacteria bacterium]MDD4917175.1 hypothetical protein [candidate division Zixibacteria bacterium]MDM7971641.1 hypothetical protein [candidate division Zixibacteria bacterium]HOD65817.1 hypothetical protein [candidate division Zixibacteria bacterium]HPC11341.1 hypothetical protein [candidate division Zixibacteria bacterium]